MSFLEHLDELRKRIVNSVHRHRRRRPRRLRVHQPNLQLHSRADAAECCRPGVKMIYTQPGEAFGLYITIALIVGVVIASPYVMYQVWMFIAPGLYSNEKRFAVPFVLFTTIGFVAGAAFNHYIAFPVHDGVLRQLQRHRSRLHAAARGHVRPVHEDAARHGPRVPDADRRVLPREDEAGDRAVPLAATASTRSSSSSSSPPSSRRPATR